MYYGSNHLELVQSPSVAAVETNTATSSSAPSPQLALCASAGGCARELKYLPTRDRWRPTGTRSCVFSSRRRASGGGCRCRRTARLRAATRSLAASASSGHVRMGATCQPRTASRIYPGKNLLAPRFACKNEVSRQFFHDLAHSRVLSCKKSCYSHTAFRKQVTG